MSQTLSVRDVSIGKWILSVTTRDNGDDPKHLEELTYRTIMTWVNIARRLEKENYVYEGGSVEAVYASELTPAHDTDAPQSEPFEFKETFGDSRVTVWSTHRGASNPNFHLNSCDIPQVAINVWRANQTGSERAIIKLESLFPKTAPNITQDTPPVVNPPEWDAIPSANQKPPQNAQQPHSLDNGGKVQGAIVATRAPNPNTPQYAHGQLVSFAINKIEITSNNGSAVYKFWGPLGQRYALLNLYMKKADGTPQPAYEALKPILAPLGLSLEKPSINGNWIALAQASHATKDNVTKEYMNIQNLTAI